ncbi:MAG: molybdenum cofactor biosynthesis protein MoaB [Nitrincola sp.]|nr:molybdenum cofactor biosynthesis protein MoaB [Nitrincola sp.]
MSKTSPNALFKPVNINLLTVSSSRTLETDDAGNELVKAISSLGHYVYERRVIHESLHHIRALVSNWIVDDQVNAILVLGGTGFSENDMSPEALEVLFDKRIDGYGELFRYLSFTELGSAAIQSRAVAGVANQTVIFTMPSSPKGSMLAWEQLISPQLDARVRPCNFVSMLLEGEGKCETRAISNESAKDGSHE